MSARPSRSPPSTSATRRRRLIARRARCQLDTGLGRPTPRSLPGAWSRTQDQEDDRPTRQWGTTSQDLRGRRFAPPCAASEAARRRHTSPPSEARADAEARFARGGRDPAQGPAPARACQEDGSPSRSTRGSAERRASSGEREWPSSWQARGPPSASKRLGHAARPAGRRAGRSRRASEASPGVSTALKAGMTPWHRFRSGAGRSEATTASYGSSRLARRVGLSSSWSLGRPQLWAASRSAEREPDGGAAAHRALT